MEDKRERNTDKLATEVMNKLAETEILPSCLPKNYLAKKQQGSRTALKEDTVLKESYLFSVVTFLLFVALFWRTGDNNSKIQTDNPPAWCWDDEGCDQKSGQVCSPKNHKCQDASSVCSDFAIKFEGDKKMVSWQSANGIRHLFPKGRKKVELNPVDSWIWNPDGGICSVRIVADRVQQPNCLCKTHWGTSLCDIQKDGWLSCEHDQKNPSSEVSFRELASSWFPRKPLKMRDHQWEYFVKKIPKYNQLPYHSGRVRERTQKPPDLFSGEFWKKKRRKR